MQLRCVSNCIGIPILSAISIHFLITGIIPSTDIGITCPITLIKGEPKSLAIFIVSLRELIVFGKATINGVRPIFSISGCNSNAFLTSEAPRSIAIPL